MSEIYGVRIVSSLKPSTIFIQSSETVLNTSMLELFGQFFLDLLFPLLGIFKVFLGCAKVFPWYITSKVWFLLHGSFRVAVSVGSTLLCLLYWCSFLPKEGAFLPWKYVFINIHSHVSYNRAVVENCWIYWKKATNRLMFLEFFLLGCLGFHVYNIFCIPRTYFHYELFEQFFIYTFIT